MAGWMHGEDVLRIVILVFGLDPRIIASMTPWGLWRWVATAVAPVALKPYTACPCR
jgi:hypothetical protein